MVADEIPPQNVAHLFFGDAMMRGRSSSLLPKMAGTPSTGGECNPWSFVLEGLAATTSLFVTFNDDSELVNNSSTKRYETAFLLCLAASALCFVVSTLSSNYSQVDKIWSIIPVLYAWIAVYPGGDGHVDPRTLMMAVLATIWGVRLTWNFHRRGGYTWPPWRGDEDYRWAYIQQGEYLPILAKPLPWMLFNLFFISIYQNVLLLLITLPSLFVADLASRAECRHIVVPLSLSDFSLGLVFVVLIGLETLADNQQWNFQQEKAILRKKGDIDLSKSATDDFAAGFYRSGLFAILRKPNYSCEQAIWICNYFFTVTAANGATEYLINWSCVGCVLLVLLFQGSGAFTEKLSSAKYPAYSQYQKDVPLYVPSYRKVLELVMGRSEQKVE